MKALFVKAYFSLLDLFGRSFIFNTNPPEVGKFIPDQAYGQDDPEKQSMDIVVPLNSSHHPILIYIHGGGWLSGNKKNYRRICRLFASAGYLVFNLNYRLSPQHPYPVPLKDISKAVQWIQNHAGEYGGDVSRIFLAGDSAGAHLASLMAAVAIHPELQLKTSIEDTIPVDHLKGLLLFYGAYNLEAAECRFPFAKTMSESFLGPASDRPSNLTQIVSPIHHLGPDFPPVFICSGEGDMLHPQSVDFAKTAKEAGIPMETLFFSRKEHPEAFHAFLNYYFLKSSQIAIRRALEFMARHSGIDILEETAS